MESVVLVAAGALILALIALNVMAAQGRFDSEEEPPPAATPATTGEDGTDAPTREPTASKPEAEAATTETEITETAATGAAITHTEPPPRLVLTAARGECYLLVRRGSAEGEVLYEAILPQNGAVDFSAPQLWLRIGASANLDATLDGEPLELPNGTVDVIVTRDGARLVS